eukprot:CAMPEP_0197419794 /NCGR_PEP_ID=MMETSP1170-20131217/5311_1 /TAXON_ID=54406 /ORGANISM="Sarcinochrysis sp, Strain CCMP770" /LENGTH=83 /DNA_ID=CAMNT_0042946909 /DNA_START=120 /DNA_END=367 /DNA_ORIENTATION=-
MALGRWATSSMRPTSVRNVVDSTVDARLGNLRRRCTTIFRRRRRQQDLCAGVTGGARRDVAAGSRDVVKNKKRGFAVWDLVLR